MDRPVHTRPGPKSGLTETSPQWAGVVHSLYVRRLHRGTVYQHRLRGHGTSDIGGGPAGHPVRHGEDHQFDCSQRETHVYGEIENVSRQNAVAAPDVHADRLAASRCEAVQEHSAHAACGDRRTTALLKSAIAATSSTGVLTGRRGRAVKVLRHRDGTRGALDVTDSLDGLGGRDTPSPSGCRCRFRAQARRSFRAS